MNRDTPKKSLEQLRERTRAWEDNEVAGFLERQAERHPQFHTNGGIPVERVYTEADVWDHDSDDLGLPGQYPYTRGPYPTMYRSRNWTMRQIAGFGTGEDTNKRFKYLIEQGQTGLSTDFDMPTLMGYDSDHPMSEGEVGREGVAVDTVADYGGAVQGHRPREQFGVIDDQPDRLDPSRNVCGGRRKPRLRPQQAVGHDPG